MKKMIIFIMAFFLMLFLIVAISVYVKKTNEREQLVISEIREYISLTEDREVLITELKLGKTSLFSSYEEWYVTSSFTKKKYFYSEGIVSKID
ncbi:MAG: hypothetical protein RR595_03335 [Lysinibacillus sp.]